MADLTPNDLLADRWAFGPWCWVVDVVELLPVPIPCRGMQGLWPVEDSSEEAAQALDDLVPVKVLTWSALTLLQPYASAIAYGPKRIENRLWRRAVPPGGLWVGLHAGSALYCPEEELIPFRVCRRSREEQAQEFVEAVLDDWRDPLTPIGPHWPDAPTVCELPRGVLLGAMRISQILPYPEVRRG